MSTPRRPKTAPESAPPRAPLHPRNRHQGRYAFARLTQASPALAAYLLRTPTGDTSVDFSDPRAVRELNRAILRADYGIAHWDLPDGALCPPIPGRADYLHGLADLLAADEDGAIPRGAAIRVLDIGVGASAIYPLLGHAEYGWRFVGSDIAPTSLQVAAAIVASNRLEKSIALRPQPKHTHVFKGVVGPDDRFDLSLCNPPFHASAGDAASGSARKQRNLGDAGSRRLDAAPALNFGGHAHELWCAGGEAGFLRRMIRESREVGDQVLWFSSLVAKSAHLPDVRAQLRAAGAVEFRETAMAQGHKQSRFVAWTFLEPGRRAAWRALRRSQPVARV
jgi:23S rRNA (adenine1618-N6)-methyltransferase